MLSGADAASFAIMTILISVYRKKSLFPELNRLKKLITFSLLYLALWICLFAYKTEVLAVAGITESVITGLLCGIFAAIVCMIKINTEIKYRMLFFIKIKEIEAEEKVREEERKIKDNIIVQNKPESHVVQEEDEKDDILLHANPAEDKEEILNRLLDKISAKGKDALTDDEKNFLTEYSKYIK